MEDITLTPLSCARRLNMTRARLFFRDARATCAARSAPPPSARQLQRLVGQQVLPTIFESQSVLDDHYFGSLSSTFAIAVMVFQLRVVTGTPKTRSNVPR